MPTINLPNYAGWVSLGTGLTAVNIEVSGGVALFHMGSTAPVAGSIGMTLLPKIPFNHTNISAFGGGLWVRAPSEDVTVYYAGPGTTVPNIPPPVGTTAPTIGTPTVTLVDNGSTVQYTFPMPTVTGTPAPTLTRVLTLDGVDVTGAMVGNVSTVTKGVSTKALVMTYTASNGTLPNATRTISATVPAAVTVGGPILANFQSVNALGYSVTYTSPPAIDPEGAPEFFTVSRQGYLNGSAATITENRLLTNHMFQAWPNNNTLSATEVSVDRWLYDTDTITGVTNNSALVVPPPVANWAILDRTVVGNSLTLEVVAFHGSGQNGRPVDSVEFRVSDGVNPALTQMVSVPTISPNSTDQVPVTVYRVVFNITSLQDETTLVANFTAFPRIGNARSLLDTSTLTLPYESSPRYFRKSVTRSAAPLYMYFNAATGNDATGVVSSDPVVAAATPCATIQGCAARAFTLNGNVDYIVCRGSGTNVFGTVGSPTKTQNHSHIVIEPIPGTTLRVEYAATSSAQMNLASPGGETWMTFRKGQGTSMTVAKVAANANTFSRTVGLLNVRFQGGVVWEFVSGAAVGSGSTTKYAADGLTISASAASNALSNDVSTPRWRLMRGVKDDFAVNVNGWLVIGCEFTGGVGSGLQLTGAEWSGNIIAFNKFYKVTGTLIAPTGTQLNGLAFIQNLVEYTSATAGPAIRISGDNGDTNTNHVIFWHNTIIGSYGAGRNNWFYDESTSLVSRLHRNLSCIGNIHTQINNKGGEFRSNANMNGHLAYRYGVGCRGEVAIWKDADGGAGTGFSQVYTGINSAVNTVLTPLVGGFVDFQGATFNGTNYTAGAGNGDYHIGTASVAKNRVPLTPLPFDSDGRARNLTLTSAGIYV